MKNLIILHNTELTIEQDENTCEQCKLEYCKKNHCLNYNTNVN